MRMPGFTAVSLSKELCFKMGDVSIHVNMGRRNIQALLGQLLLDG
jgi:hypothetical protein